MGNYDRHYEMPLDKKHGIQIPFGCDVPDLWYDIIDDLLTELKKLPVWDEKKDDEDDVCHIHQIKEKFYELRVYTSEKIDNCEKSRQLIFEAEKKCSMIKPY